MGIRNFTIAFLLVLALAATLAGCANSFTDQPNLTTSGDKTAPGPSATEEAPVLPDQEPSDTPFIETPENEPVVGEIPPEILEKIIADLVQRTGAARQDIEVIRGEAVVWNDGSLGCPKPGEFYIQIMINGYWVVLEVEGIEYDYRVSGTDHFTLCEGRGSLPISPLGDPGGGVENSLVIQAKGDLAKRLNIPVKEIDLFSFEEVVWPDASLGCPQPGMVYIQVPQDGALIRLSAKGQVYDYHSGGIRGVFLCEQVFKIKPTTPKIDILKHTPPPRDTGDQ
jgi:hypothetical protein